MKHIIKKLDNPWKWAAVVIAIYFIALSVRGAYDGTTADQLNAARPPDTGEAASYGASAIREIKRVFLNWLAVEHYKDGTHGTNFSKAYMFATNTVPGHAITSNSIPAHAYSSNSIPTYALAAGDNSIFYITSMEATQAEFNDTKLLVSLFTESNLVSVVSNDYSKLMVTADVYFRNETGGARDFNSNTFWRIEGGSTNVLKLMPSVLMKSGNDGKISPFSALTDGGNTNTVYFDFRTKPSNGGANCGATLINFRVWGIK